MNRGIRQAIPNRLIVNCLDLVVPIALVTLELWLNFLAIVTAINMGILFLIVMVASSFVFVPMSIALFFFWWPALLLLIWLYKCSSLRTYARQKVH